MTESIKNAEVLLDFWPDTNAGPPVIRALVADLKAMLKEKEEAQKAALQLAQELAESQSNEIQAHEAFLRVCEERDAAYKMIRSIDPDIARLDDEEKKRYKKILRR